MIAPPHQETDQRTIILYGDHRPTWENLLPLLTPLFIHNDKVDRDIALVRWFMPMAVAARVGIDSSSGCNAEGCECDDRVLTAEGGFLIDTNLRQTAFIFDDVCEDCAGG